MDARSAALESKVAVAEGRKVYTDDDYKLRSAVVDFVFDNDLVTQRAIREFRKRKLGSTDYAVKTLADLGAKMNTKALSSPQLELARNILRTHQNLLIDIFGGEVKAQMQRSAKKDAPAVVVATPAVVVDDTLNENPDDSDIGF